MANRKAPRTRDNYHHGDLRRVAVTQALAAIEESGVESLTLRDVARRAGVTHAALYRHFADRRALLAAVAADALWRLTESMEKASKGAGSDLRAQFVAAGRAYVQFALDHPARFRVVSSGELDDEAADLRAAREASFAILLGFVHEGQKRKQFPQADPAALAIPMWAMHHGLATLAASGAFTSLTKASVQRTVDDAHDRLLEGLWLRTKPRK